MNKLFKLLSIALVLFTLNEVNAQELSTAEENRKEQQKDEVVVYLKSGTMFSGAVKEWKIGETITIVTDSGNEYTFSGETVDKVIQLKLYEKSMNMKFDTPYNFKESGLYYSFKGHFINGNFGDRQNENHGLGISVLVGKRFNRLLGVGVGAGYDAYILDSGERVLPIFAEVSGYISPKHTTLAYGLAAGYSLAFNNEDYNIIDAKGGLMVHPNIGIRFGKKKLKYTLDLGYRFQKAEFTYRDAWNARSRYEQRLLYKRVTLRFGVLF